MSNSDRILLTLSDIEGILACCSSEASPWNRPDDPAVIETTRHLNRCIPFLLRTIEAQRHAVEKAKEVLRDRGCHRHCREQSRKALAELEAIPLSARPNQQAQRALRSLLDREA